MTTDFEAYDVRNRAAAYSDQCPNCGNPIGSDECRCADEDRECPDEDRECPDDDRADITRIATTAERTTTTRSGLSFSEYTMKDLNELAQRLRREIRNAKVGQPVGACYIHIAEGRVSLRVNFVNREGVTDFQSVAI